MQRNSVVLPAPLGPSSATNSCSLTEKLTSSIARRPPNALLMPLISRRGRPSPFALARLVEAGADRAAPESLATFIPAACAAIRES